MYECHSQSDIPISKNENQACQAPMENGEKCGEVKTLEILKEFQQLYENKVNKIKDDCSCTSTRLKIQMLEDWVKDLSEQNTMLVQVVEELEQEASERVSLLEEKLRHSSKTSFEIMKTLQEYDAQNISSQTDTNQRLMYFQSDVNNLTEFIKRIRDEGIWNTEGLHFYSVAQEDLCEVMPSSARNLSKQTELEESLEKHKYELSKYKQRQEEFEKETKQREMLIREQTEQIEKLNDVVERCASSMPDRQKLLEELHELRTNLKLKTEDFNRLDMSVKDMREALTAEVADKHDSVVALRRELQLLEERCRQADKQTHFKDDIIKEMRKELKQYRSKFDLDAREKEDEDLRKQIKNKNEMIDIQNDTLNVAQRELKELREKLVDIEKERDTRIQEVQNWQQALKMSQNTIEELEKALRNSEEKASNIQQTADLYVETISLLETAKNKAETEVEQQRITIGNLQDALVSTKKQLSGVQGHNAAELKEKCEAIYILYQELDEMQTQYVDCYGENVKLSQTADCLRDANLELKVMNVNLQQDIEELNTKIMNDKIIIASLEENIQKIVSANELLEDDLNLMKEEISNLSSELKILERLLNLSASSPCLEENNLSLSKSLNMLHDHSETLVEQLKITQSQVSREIKLNVINTNKIEELQKLLDRKSEELRKTKFQFDDSIRQNKEYENRLKEMEKQATEFQDKYNLNEQKSDHIVLTCKSDLISVKQKTDILNKILNEKSDEILRLHAELRIQSDTITNIVKENEIMLKDNKKITQNAMNLEEQLDLFKSRCTEMNEKYNKCKIEVDNLKHWEDTLVDKYKREKSELMERLEVSQKEEAKVNMLLRESKDELEKTRISLNQKDDEVKNFFSVQQEILSLKEEINRLTKLRNRVLGENQKLQDQVSKLNINTEQFEDRNLIISQQLDKCLEELNTLQSSKDKLEERNIQLESDFAHLQRSFTEINQEIRFKTESFMNLEHELLETKCSRDEICAESRLIVSNVRNWLEEQKRINVALTNQVKEKNAMIEEVTMEKNLLMKNIKDVCERYETLTEELYMCRQYLSEMTEDQFKMKKSVYSWSPQNSGGDSPVSSPVFIEEQNYNYMCDENDGKPNPTKWMRKAQNMSEDLLKTKKFWQTKTAKSSKKMKLIKDSKKTST